MPIRAFVFDAYGTLYDIQSVLTHVERACPGRGALITQIWRLKQLEYTWLRTSMGAFADFAVVTRDSLIFALQSAGIMLNEAMIADLDDTYLHLTPVPEAREALEGLAGHQPPASCNQRAHDPPMFAILTTDDCWSLQIASCRRPALT